MIKVIKIKAKRAFNPSKIPGAKYVINQYIGCQIACSYCYAKFVSRWYNYGEWGDWVIVKENMPELVKNKYLKGKIYMSSISDAYQPIEAKIKLTRKVLENMSKNIELVILTKSSLVLRDIDIFKEFNDIEVGLTINGFNNKIKREIEPFSSTHNKRVEALKNLHKNGIKTYAFISPIIPDLVDVGNIIDETKDFVDYYWMELLNLKVSGKEFKNWLKQNYQSAYEILNEKPKLESYMEKIVDAVKRKNVNIKGISINYSKIVKCCDRNGNSK